MCVPSRQRSHVPCDDISGSTAVINPRTWILDRPPTYNSYRRLVYIYTSHITARLQPAAPYKVLSKSKRRAKL